MLWIGRGRSPACTCTLEFVDSDCGAPLCAYALLVWHSIWATWWNAAHLPSWEFMQALCLPVQHFVASLRRILIGARAGACLLPGLCSASSGLTAQPCALVLAQVYVYCLACAALPRPHCATFCTGARAGACLLPGPCAEHVWAAGSHCGLPAGSSGPPSVGRQRQPEGAAPGLAACHPAIWQSWSSDSSCRQATSRVAVRKAEVAETWCSHAIHRRHMHVSALQGRLPHGTLSCQFSGCIIHPVWQLAGLRGECALGFSCPPDRAATGAAVRKLTRGTGVGCQARCGR